MCGIGGIITTKPDNFDPRVALEVSAAMSHRGPDDLGYLAYFKGEVTKGRSWPLHPGPVMVALVHRRLSIIDLSDGGWQPMSSSDGRYHVVFNGEIYNYIELRDDLVRLGYRFSSGSDTEVLLTAVAAWGVAAVSRFIGMFAFAVLDVEEECLVLGRDFIGIKPLYYAESSAGFAFASEIKALLKVPWVGREADAQRVYDFLRYGLTSHGNGTILRNVQQVAPAHYMIVPLRAPHLKETVRYWAPDLTLRCDLSFEGAARELRNRFLRNVELHTRSDVPIGSALSGGIDSSAVVMSVRKVRGGTFGIDAFGFVAPDESVSEERWIDLVGDAAGARVHKVTVEADELLSDVEEMIYMYDEPLPSSTNYAEYRLSRLTRDRGIKVILSGQGGDELLAGYLSYVGARASSLLLAGRTVEAARLVREAARKTGRRSWQLIFETMGYLLPSALQGIARRLVGRDLVPGWLNKGAVRERGVIPTVITERVRERNVLRETLAKSLFVRGLPHLLRYEDRRSMAYSIESRVPFLTQDLVQFVLGLPEEYLISADGTTKAVFRRAMKGLVPDAILGRHDKLGFATPEARWALCLKPWIDRVLSSQIANEIPLLRIQRVREHWDEIARGHRKYSRHIWRCCQLIEWVRIFEASVA